MPWTGEYDHESSPGLFTSPTPSYLKEEPPDVPLLEESLPPLSKGEPCAPTHAPDDNSNIENFNYHYNIVPGLNNDDDVDEGNVDADPPKGSVYDPISEGEATTITEVIAGSDVKEKDNAVIVATESDTHIKIIGYNCGYYYDCDYGHEYDTRD